MSEFFQSGGGGSPSISWTGYHDISVLNWFFDNTGAYADPSSNSSNGNAIVVVDNNGFGTVASYATGSRKLPGIVFTPTRIARYRISAVIAIVGAPAVSQWITLRLTDGTTTITTTSSVGTAASVPVTLSGILNITSLSQVTIRIEGIVSTGSGTITTTGVGQSMISWAIESI